MRVLNERIIQALNVREEYVERVVAKEMAEIERRLCLLCGKRPSLRFVGEP